MKRKNRKLIDIRERQTDYPCKPLYEDAPTESVTPEASEQDPLDIVDAGALIDYVFGEIDDTIKFAKDELYADEDDEEDVKAPHMTETLFPEDGLEKHVYELGYFPGEDIGKDRRNSFNPPTASQFGKAKIERLNDVNHARQAPHITEELSYVCADPEYDARFAVTGWDGDITEAMSFRVPFVEVDAHGPRLRLRGALVAGELETGDAGYVDDRGNVHVSGRADAQIISGGENIDPEQIERALLRHPAVASAAVVGLPDAVWGMRPHAALVLTSGERTPSDHELSRHLREQVARFKVPDSFTWLDGLPSTSLGKVARARLRQRLTKDEATPSQDERHPSPRPTSHRRSASGRTVTS